MKKINFIGHDNWKFPFPTDSDVTLLKVDDIEVLVLRTLLFFYKGEKTTINELRIHFTDHAIDKLIHDKFIKIK